MVIVTILKTPETKTSRRKFYNNINKNDTTTTTNYNNDEKLSLQLPHRGQHSPSGTVALAHGIRGQEILRHTVTEFWQEKQVLS